MKPILAMMALTLAFSCSSPNEPSVLKDSFNNNDELPLETRFPRVVVTAMDGQLEYDQYVVISNGRAFHLQGCSRAESLDLFNLQPDSKINVMFQWELDEDYDLDSSPRINCEAGSYTGHEDLNDDTLYAKQDGGGVKYYTKNTSSSDDSYLSLSFRCLKLTNKLFMNPQIAVGGRPQLMELPTISEGQEMKLGCADPSNPRQNQFDPDEASTSLGWSLYTDVIDKIVAEVTAPLEAELCQELSEDGAQWSDGRCVHTKDSCRSYRDRYGDELGSNVKITWKTKKNDDGDVAIAQCISITNRHGYVISFRDNSPRFSNGVAYSIKTLNGVPTHDIIELNAGNSIRIEHEETLKQAFGIPVTSSIGPLIGTELKELQLGSLILEICTTDSCPGNLGVAKYVRDPVFGTYFTMGPTFSVSSSNHPYVLDGQLNQHKRIASLTSDNGASGSMVFDQCQLNRDFATLMGLGFDTSFGDLHLGFAQAEDSRDFVTRSSQFDKQDRGQTYFVPCVEPIKVCKKEVIGEVSFRSALQGQGCGADDRELDITLKSDIRLFKSRPHLKVSDIVNGEGKPFKFIRISGAKEDPESSFKISLNCVSSQSEVCSAPLWDRRLLEISTHDALVEVSNVRLEASGMLMGESLLVTSGASILANLAIDDDLVAEGPREIFEANGITFSAKEGAFQFNSGLKLYPLEAFGKTYPVWLKNSKVLGKETGIDGFGTHLMMENVEVLSSGVAINAQNTYLDILNLKASGLMGLSLTDSNLSYWGGLFDSPLQISGILGRYAPDEAVENFKKFDLLPDPYLGYAGETSWSVLGVYLRSTPFKVNRIQVRGFQEAWDVGPSFSGDPQPPLDIMIDDNYGEYNDQIGTIE